MAKMNEDTLLSLVVPGSFFEQRKTAMIFWDGEKPVKYAGRTSYGDLSRKSSLFGSFLKDMGVLAGDRVGLMLPNSPQFAIVYFGALKIGAIAVPINPLYANDQKTLLAVIRDAGIRLIVAWDLFLGALTEMMNCSFLEKIIVTGPSDALPLGKAIIYNWRLKKSGSAVTAGAECGRAVSFSQFQEMWRPEPDIEIKPQDPAVILYTSGTSGEPKGVVHTQESLYANAVSCEKLVLELGMERGKEIFLAAAPFFHVMGITAMLHLPLLMRSKIILLPKPREIGKLLEAITSGKPTGFVGFPKLYDAMNQKLQSARKEYDVSSLKVCISGAAKLQPETVKKFGGFWDGRILEGYGSTEAGVSHCQRPADGSGIGIVLCGAEEKLLDADENNAGELLVRGKSVMRGYWRKSKETAEVLDEDGWFHTGDMAKTGANGEMYILGRINDDFVKGSHGEKIPLGGAERILGEHPKVKEAAVVAVPKAKDKFLLRAFVVLDGPGTILNDTLREDFYEFLKALPAEQVPDEILEIAEIPKNPMGKVLKKVLRNIN